MPENYIIYPGIKEALTRYVQEHVEPGGFLRAVLENDLREACERADDFNQRHLWDLVAYCYNHIPYNCWGSKKAVSNWLNSDD